MISLTTRSAISFFAPCSFSCSKNDSVSRSGFSAIVDGFLLLAAADLDVARFHAQTRAVAGRALLLVDELGQFFLHRHRIGFAVAARQVVHHAFERVFLDHGAAALVDVGERDLVLPSRAA
jgi:hypothetical protein